MKVLIVHDRVPEVPTRDQADVLVQARAVADALTALGHEWMTLGVTLDLDAASTSLQQLKPDLIFNLVESLDGIGRLIHLPCYLFDALGVPYTGASAEGVLQTSNKLLAKRMLQVAGIDTPRWYMRDDLSSSCCEVLQRQYIIKSVWEHASIGLDEGSVIHASSAADLLNAIEQRVELLGGEGFAEQFIDGREFNLGLLTCGRRHPPQVLRPAEIVFEGGVFGDLKIVGYRAKWEEDSPEYQHTLRRYEFPSSDASLLEQMSSMALQCWRCFDLHGYARVDFRVDATGRPWVLEVNANPCLSPDAGFAAALQQSSIDYNAAIGRVLHDVAERPGR